MKLSKPEFPLRTTLFYLLFGSLWILLSDQLLALLVVRNTQQVLYQTIKGWFFILISGILLYILLHRDLSKRRQAEVALRESEERFRLLFEKNPAVMMLIEPVSGAIRDANQSAVAFYGYPITELRGINISDINQLSPEEVQAERMRALREERNFFNFEHRLANGEIRLVEVHSAPIRLGAETLLFSIIHDATERRRAQQELQDIQNRMKGIVEAAMDAIISTDINQTIVLANPAAEAIFGYGKGELLGKPLDLLLPERYRQVHNEHVRRFGQTGTTTRSMHALDVVYGVRSGGQEFPAEASISQISIGSEKIYTVILRDITQRRQAEAAVQQGQKRFQSLIEHAPDGIALLGLDGRLRQVTPSTERILGYTDQEVVAQDPALLTHPEDLVRLLELINNIIQNPGKTVHAEYRFRHKNGSWRWLHSAITNLTAEPSVNAIVFNYRDVTDQKQAEERIQRQLQRLHALHDIDVAISSSFGMQSSLEVVLKETCIQLGIDAASILVLHPATLSLEYVAGNGFHSSAIEDTRVRIGEGLAGRAALERHSIFLDDLAQADSSFVRSEMVQSEGFMSYFVTPLITRGEVKGVLEVFHRSPLHTSVEWLDFLETLAGQAAIAIENAQLFENLRRSNLELEQRVMERTRELNRTNAELERANRAKDEFLATMSHELRTPLNSILGLSESLLEERRGSLNAHQHNSIHIIESSGHHLLELINDILDLSKIEAGKFELLLQTIAVDEFCNSCMAFVKAQAIKKSLSLTYSNDAHIARVQADPRRLKQILVNLLINAVKFTPDHGQVSLQVSGDREKQSIQFSVIDTGIGIAPEDLGRLFQPFVQLDSQLSRQYQGTGLGLALVQKLTDLHGGSVQVQSEVGKGSCFTIHLAGIPDDDPRPDALAASLQPGSIYGVDLAKDLVVSSDVRRSILLVDDNAPNILTVRDYLEGHHYEVLVAHNGIEAISEAQRAHPALILMDIQMPVMNGLDAIARLRADHRFATTPIIALTALAMPGDRERCLAAGASEYMSKPVSLNLLLSTIDRWLQNESGG